MEFDLGKHLRGEERNANPADTAGSALCPVQWGGACNERRVAPCSPLAISCLPVLGQTAEAVRQAAGFLVMTCCLAIGLNGTEQRPQWVAVEHCLM